METEYPDNALLRLPEVLRLVPVSKSSWWEGCRTGRFPQPIKISERVTAWRYSDIIDFLDKLPRISPSAPRAR